MISKHQPPSQRLSERQDLQEALHMISNILGDVLKLIEFQSYAGLDLSAGINLKDVLRDFEIVLIKNGLRIAQGRQRKAASLMGIPVSTLNHKMKLYGIRPRDICR